MRTTTETINNKTLKTLIPDAELCFMREAVFTGNSENTSRYVIAASVSSNFIVILYHPKSKLTLTAYVNDDIEIDQQNRLLQKFLMQNNQIKTNEICVYLIGGQKAHFSSEKYGENLRYFWKSKSTLLNKIDDSLLFQRNMYILPVVSIRDIFDALYSKFEKDKVDSIIERNNKSKKPGIIYSGTEDEDEIAANIRESITRLMKKRYPEISKNYFQENKLMSASYIHDNAMPNVKKFIVDYDDPKKCFFSAIAFDRESSQILICEELWENRADVIHSNKNYETRYNNQFNRTNMSFLDKSNKNLNSTAPTFRSPFRAAEDSHNSLQNELKQYKNEKNKSFFDAIENRLYGAALRRACTCKDDSMIPLIEVLLSYKTKLPLNINEKNSSNMSALDYAEKSGNVKAINLLREHGAVSVISTAALGH